MGVSSGIEVRARRAGARKSHLYDVSARVAYPEPVSKKGRGEPIPATAIFIDKGISSGIEVSARPRHKAWRVHPKSRFVDESDAIYGGLGV